MTLSRNDNLPWDVELLSKFADKWKWGHINYNKTFDEKSL